MCTRITNNIKDKYSVGDTSYYNSVIEKANEKQTRLCTNYFYTTYVITKLKYYFISFLYKEPNE